MNINLLVAALLTIGIYTLLFRENPIYRFIEHLFVGTAMGYSLVVAYRNIKSVGVDQITKGNYIYILPMILGIMMYSRYFGRNYRWMNRIPVSLLLGSSIGITLRGIPEVSFFRQLQATFAPIVGSGSIMGDFNNIIIIISFFFTLLYFTFTIKMPGKTGITLKLGRYFLMVYMGSLYGNVIIHRASLLISRFQFILFDLLQL
jgi:hypothetical protein